MSNLNSENDPDDLENRQADQGKLASLIWNYALLALGLLAAMGVAALIVRPFYLRH